MFCFIIMKKVLLIASIAIIFASCEDGNPHEPSKNIEFQDPIAKVICTLYWDLNKDGELSYSEASVVTDIRSVFKDSSIITFNELKYFTGLTTIGESAFEYCSSLTSVTIPDSVTEIGEWAFSDCDSLTSITIPDSVTSIGGSAFRYCDSLRSVTIGDSVTTIGDDAFSSCDSLTSVTIPDSVTTIGGAAFCFCDSLTSVAIGNSVTTIGNESFAYCNSLTSVTIGSGVTTIGESAFQDCSSLTSVYCKAITPPAGGPYMFSYNASGRKIYVSMESVEAYKSASYWKYYADAIEGYNF